MGEGVGGKDIEEKGIMVKLIWKGLRGK